MVSMSRNLYEKPWFNAMACALMCSISISQALSPIQIKGSKFYQDENQFFIKGIAYQLSPSDPLLDAQVCEENFALMAEAGTNVIRVCHMDFHGVASLLTSTDLP